MTERPTPRTWNDGWRCAECCNGDRCDDPTHHDRDKCPHCKGTGIAVWNMYTKEAEAKALITERNALRKALLACVNLLEIWSKWTPEYCTAHRDFERLPEIQRARALLDGGEICTIHKGGS